MGWNISTEQSALQLHWRGKGGNFFFFGRGPLQLFQLAESPFDQDFADATQVKRVSNSVPYLALSTHD